jgi:hypothetical protein
MEITFDSIIGKHLLIGLTYMNCNGEATHQTQLHGDVIFAEEGNVITIKRADNGEYYYMPPDLSAIGVAEKGVYTLRSTGEVVTDPDLLSSWIIESPREEPEVYPEGYVPA